MITHQTTRKDLMIEARFLPESIEQATQLRSLIHQVVEAGEVDGIAPSQAEAYADQVTGWLIGKTQGVDRKGPNTRSKYRKILQVLEEQVPTGGQRGFAGHPGIAGVLGSLATAGALAGAGNPIGAALALALVPIIYEPGYVADIEELPELVAA